MSTAKKIAKGLALILIKAASYPISLFERALINRYSSLPMAHSPIFIVGAPRTGSTALYQAITNELDVIYVDNLHCALRRTFFVGAWLSSKLFGEKAHGTWYSRHGNTPGLHGPSECGGFWYRWFPVGRHFVAGDDLSEKACGQIYKEIAAVSNYFGKPIVFKNLNAGQRMQVLTRIFPRARWIFIRREPFFTAQSILLSKRSLGMREDEFWSIMPREIDELRDLPWPQQIARQIYGLERQIVEDLKLVSSENCMELHYSALSGQTVGAIAEKFGIEFRANAKPTFFRVNEKVLLSEQEANLLSEAVESLDWSALYPEDA